MDNSNQRSSRGRRDTQVYDPASQMSLTLRVKGFREGTVSGNAPTVVLAVLESGGMVAGQFELAPEQAQAFGEYLRQEAEYASTKEEE